jgi:hypothetical protein
MLDSNHFILKFIFSFANFVLIFCTFEYTLAESLNQRKVQPKVSFTQGKCFFQPEDIKRVDTQALKPGIIINQLFPYALVTGKDSYLEVLDYPESKNVFRLGQSSAIENRQPYHLYYFQGSSLISNRDYAKWRLETKSTLIHIYAQGTWMVETTEQLGLKIILLEGTLQVLDEKEPLTLSAGELVLVSEKNDQTSQTIKIDLPLMLNTCRLINNFETKLPSLSRLISAAQVQSIRLKKRYEAVVGGVKENKLQIWAIKKE